MGAVSRSRFRDGLLRNLLNNQSAEAGLVGDAR